MKRYNVQNYVRWKLDLEDSLNLASEGKYSERHNIIIENLELVESVARSFSTSDQASGVLSINDLLQSGAEGLIYAVDRIDWNVVNESEHPEKTLKSFLSKRIRGSIRREIDINRGNMRIPEYKLNEIRKSDGGDKMIVQMFFNSIFSSIDIEYENEEDNVSLQIPDKSEKYNIDIINKYLLGLMKSNLLEREYDVLRMSYGLDCDKMTAKQIAAELNIEGTANYVRVSQIKRDAIDKLVQNVDQSQVLDFL
jgi:RNA polymerase sigma factor (sigma-70 family)|tara:strand:- start:354 stop:1109 length:756 start_codon:yes stop_codon:yes gene_type:complete